MKPVKSQSLPDSEPLGYLPSVTVPPGVANPLSLPAASPNAPLTPGAPGSPGTTTAPAPSPSPDYKDNPWEICLDYAKRNVEEEVKVCKEEITNFVIFAALFAGVAGIFSVEAYHNVRQDPANTTVLLLKSMLAAQLNATSAQPQTNLPIDLNPIIPITASAKRINIYNFLSLILSLSVAMAEILCLQWLREYEKDPCGIPKPRREHLGIRCMKNKGMKKWHVFTVLKTLPLVLLLSLLLFFAGIIELLLGIDRIAAILVSIVIGFAVAFIAVTTALPTFMAFRVRWVGQHRFPQCPWKSGQAWVFYQFFDPFLRLIASATSMFGGKLLPDDIKEISRHQDWSVYDWLVYKSSDITGVGFGIHWLGKMYLQEKKLAEALYRCICDTSTHDSLQQLMINKDSRRAASIDRASDWRPTTGADLELDEARAAHIADVTVFQTLAHLVEKIECGHPSDILLEQRLDLFCKINEKYRDKDIDCPLIGGMGRGVLKSSNTRRKLLRCITDLITDVNAGINQSHLAALTDIFNIETNTPHPKIELFDEVLVTLDGWIIENSDEKTGGGEQNSGSLLMKARKLENRIKLLRGFVCNRDSTYATFIDGGVA